MKLILAVVNREDTRAVTDALSDGGFSSTWLTTSGGFLHARNATMLVGVEEEKVEQVLEIVKTHCHSRKRTISSAGLGMSREAMLSMPVEVKVGGAVVFVLDAEQFMKI